MLFCPPPKIRKKSYMSERQWEAKLLICFAQTNGGSIATTPFCKWSLLLSKRGGRLLTSHLYRHYPCVYIITCSFLMLSLRKQSVPSGKTRTFALLQALTEPRMRFSMRGFSVVEITPSLKGSDVASVLAQTPLLNTNPSAQWPVRCTSWTYRLPFCLRRLWCRERTRI